MSKRTLNIKSLSRTIWASQEDKDEWKEKRRQASRTHSRAETEMVAEGYRKAGTTHINKRNYYNKLQTLSKKGLIFTPIRKTTPLQGFTHTHFEPKENEDYDIYGAITRNSKHGQQFKEYEEEKPTNHEGIGELLGFPECCRGNFKNNWEEHLDPMVPAIDNMDNSEYHKEEEIDEGVKHVYEVDHIPPETNQLLRYWGIRVTSHLPHSFDCEKTIEFGKKWIEVMEQHNEEGLEYLLELLNKPIRWDQYRGILEVTTPHFRGITTTGYTDERYVIKVKGEKLDW